MPLSHLCPALDCRPVCAEALAGCPDCWLKMPAVAPASVNCCLPALQSRSTAALPAKLSLALSPAGVQGQWHTRTGSFKSIMAIVTPCRSDQSTLGLAPYSHLSDGRIQLVLVKECSILQYLQFLASIPQSGRHGSGSRRRQSSSSMAFATCGVVADRLASCYWAASCSCWCLVPWRGFCPGSPFDAGVVPGKFSYVDIVEATAVHVEPVGKESRWNVDGELLETNHVNAQVRDLLTGLLHDFLLFICTGSLGKSHCSCILPWAAPCAIVPTAWAVWRRAGTCMNAVRLLRPVQCLLHGLGFLHHTCPECRCTEGLWRHLHEVWSSDDTPAGHKCGPAF